MYVTTYFFSFILIQHRKCINCKKTKNLFEEYNIYVLLFNTIVVQYNLIVVQIWHVISWWCTKMHWTWHKLKTYLSVFPFVVPVEDPLKEMAEYMESSRDEVWEKTSCNKQVTLLVYQEGDQLNFFRVVDRGDGTLTPLSESLRWIGFHLRVSLRKGEHHVVCP